jgi:hypothetical protein
MSRKVEVEVKVKLQLVVDEGVEVSEIMDEIDYSFTDTTTQADVVDSTIEDYEIIDSR